MSDIYLNLDIKELFVVPESRLVVAEFQDGQKFQSYVADIAELEKVAIASGVKFTVSAPPASIGIIISQVIFFILIGGLIWWIFSKQGQMPGFQKFATADKFGFEKKVQTRFDDIAGCDEATEEVAEVVDFLKNPERYKALGAKMPKGILLVGPPGTGKTLMARAIAGEAGMPFIVLAGSSFVELFVGMGARKIRELFGVAKKIAPCIVFIDEIDAVGRARGLSSLTHDEREQTLNQLLSEMDGFDQDAGVFFLAATNRPEILDPALTRSGRFDRRLVLPLPDIKGREAILEIHCRDKALDPDVNLLEIARATPGLSGADLATILNEGVILACRRRHRSVTQKDITDALEKVLWGPERKIVISLEERQIIALHEAGHTLAAKYTDGADPIRKVTIMPRGTSLGSTRPLPPQDRHILSKRYLMSQLAVCMGGRAAEMLAFNQESTGARSDFEVATQIARAMVCEYGMSEKLGKVVFTRRGEFLGSSEIVDCAEETKRLIDEEIKHLLDIAYDQTSTILQEHRKQLDVLAQALLERETLDAKEIDEVISNT